MLSKNKIKYVQSLKLKKFRQKYNNFIVEGDKIARELLLQSKLGIELVFSTESWYKEHQSILRKHIDKTIIVNESELNKITALSTPNEVLIIAKQQENFIEKEFLTHDFSLYLDDIQDPGNMGTIIRIADWFGLKQVICSKNCVDIYNPKVLQSTMGGFIRVATPKMDFQRLIKDFPDTRIYGTVMNGENIYEYKGQLKGVLVIGNEGRGIQKDVRDQMHQGFSIPKGKNGGAESLNAAVATGILISHFRNNF